MIRTLVLVVALLSSAILADSSTLFVAKIEYIGETDLEECAADILGNCMKNAKYLILESKNLCSDSTSLDISGHELITNFKIGDWVQSRPCHHPLAPANCSNHDFYFNHEEYIFVVAKFNNGQIYLTPKNAIELFLLDINCH